MVATSCELWLQMMENLDWPNAVKEIVQAEKFLRAEGSPKVASIGFCMGMAHRRDLILKANEKCLHVPKINDYHYQGTASLPV